MKRIDTPSTEPAMSQELEDKVGEILSLLSAEPDPQRRLLLTSLSGILRSHAPLYYLEMYPASDIVAWLGRFLDFIALRREAVTVETFPTSLGNRALLLTNTPDAPYLLDSLQNVLSGAELRFRVLAHPILRVRRKEGVLLELDESSGAGPHESFMIIKVEGLASVSAPALLARVKTVLAAALQAHSDRDALRRQFKALEGMVDSDGYRDFWRWLSDGNFIPLAGRQFQVAGGARGRVGSQGNGRLGLDDHLIAFPEPGVVPLQEYPPPFKALLLRQEAVVVEELSVSSPVHRADPLVYIGVREVLAGDAWREHVFVGLFAERTLEEGASHVPALRRRIEGALASLSVPKECHDYRKILEIVNSFPKAEMFFMSPAALRETVRSFTLLYRHDAVKVVAIRSLAVQGLKLLVIMPRDFFSDETLLRIEVHLRRFFRAPAVTSRIVHISSDYLSLHASLISGDAGEEWDLPRLENALTRIARPWERKLQLLLEGSHGEMEGSALFRRYRGSFSREYRALTHPRFALRDILNVERVLKTREEIFDLWGPFGQGTSHYRLQFYSTRKNNLNALMPYLENLNLSVIEEVDLLVEVAGTEIHIKSFAVRGPEEEAAGTLSTLAQPLLEALGALRRRVVENDYLNRLLLLTGLSWRQIDIFRGYRNYYFQLGSPFSKRRVAFALINNPRVALLLYRYFENRFRVDSRLPTAADREEQALSPLRLELSSALESVSDVNEDNILRTLFNLIDSTVRTNFFVRRDSPDYFFAFKISAIGIIEMPAPRPLFEIYVHAAEMEGIHLRGGKVARGGIRWSDRPDDFRTEILGLMKTQMTKNALIVPVGSKGGFVLKTPFATREEGGELSRAAYRKLMRGLLDLTDNRRGAEVIRPEGVVAYDEIDPYLVVAADKGTAHLSDTANAISAEYGFWLGDAFASGGSHGYDHKELGITARGAWESVKRHFLEIGRDIMAEPFTLVGIGDMSGDVFGNGMLLSRQIRLKAAFDHRHIFLDPDPDPATSFAERHRLFALPRSSWDDYDRSLLSRGGGIYPRSAKEIPLSAEVRQWLGVRHESMDPQGLIRLLLNAEVDLLWNGGIGTYVKASNEKNEEVGDRASDSLRVDGNSLRALVVGEGGNLGFTQRGRIEYALAGGRINTDAVDNSGGVDCSDHEVNLKILMQHLRETGEVTSDDQRDRLLQSVTDEVCAAVLANNYGQSLCLSLDMIRSGREVEVYLDLADRLAGAGLLDRRGEYLPTAKEVVARPQGRLTRPELSILMAYAKMQIYQALLESTLPEQEGVRDLLAGYFPAPIASLFAGNLAGHPLAREITATVITNRVINQAGSPFASTLARKAGASLVEAVAAYLAFDAVLEGSDLRRRIFAVDGRLPAAEQYDLLLALEGALSAMTSWALKNGVGLMPGGAILDDYRQQLLGYQRILGGILGDEEWARCKERSEALEALGFSADSALKLTTLSHLEEFLPLVTLAGETKNDLYSVAQTCREVKMRLGIDELRAMMARVRIGDRWDRMAYQALVERTAAVSFALTEAVFRESAGNLEAYLAPRRKTVRFYQGLKEGLRSGPAANYHPFTVLVGTLEEMLSFRGPARPV
jgi:glutamate dehydrogenase